jgi:D-alanyl-D-alanine carboxypeptidase (penicillin-binding protein 5/6)
MSLPISADRRRSPAILQACLQATLLAALSVGALQTSLAAAPAAPQSAPVTTGMSGELPPPTIAAKAFALVDMSTGQRLAAQDADNRVEPASLTKLMTAYLIFSALRDKQLTQEQTIAVSQRAWKASGSRMFIEPNKPVTVGELLRGMIIQSGNDASVALAEAVAGDEAQFAVLMNREAGRLGMKNTQFRNATGLPDPQHFSTAQDLSLLAGALVRDFPDFYKLYSEREYTYNGIRQANRNRLLSIDSSVDGMKTGFTEAAGYCLVSSAKRTLPNGVDRRLVSVVLGAPSDNVRAQESLKLLNYGFQMFETVKLYGDNQVVSSPDVFKGARPTLKTGFQRNVIISVPRGAAGKLQASFQKVDPLIAPIKAGQPVGQLQVSLDGKVLLETPVVALEDMETAGLVGRLVDSGKLWWKNRQ